MRWLNPKRLVEGGGQGPEAGQMRALLEQLSQEAPPLPVAESAMRARIWSRLSQSERRSHRELRWLFAGAAALSILLIAALALRGRAPLRELQPAQDLEARAEKIAAPPEKIAAPAEKIAAPAEQIAARADQIAPPAAPASRASIVSGAIFSSENQLAVGSAVSAGSELHTAQERAILRVNGFAKLLVQPQSSLRVDAAEGRAQVQIDRGELIADVKTELREVLEIHLGESDRAITVRSDNALFSIREAAAGAFVSVSRGSVLVEQSSLAYRIAQGHSWSSRAPTSLGPDTIRASDRALLDSPMPSIAPSLASPLAPPIAPSVQPVLEEKKQIPTQRRRGAKGLAEEAPAPDLKSANVEDAASTTPIAQGSAAQRAAAGAPPARQVAVIDPAIDPYREAEKLLARHQPEQAAQGFAAIVAQHGAHRDLALYELGRVRQRDLNDPAGALQAFRSYQLEYPKGALSQEVALSLIDLELGNASSQDRAAALDGITDFLSEHPKSERAAEMHLLRGNLLRERGECARAISDYAQASGPFAGDALYFTAFCQRAMGRAADAKTSLMHYLAQFPDGGHRGEAQAALAASP